MADKRITDFTEASSAGADYYLVTDSLSDGVKKIKPANIVPAFTGDVTKTAGGTVTTIANNAVTNTKAAQMAAGTIKSNLTGALASASDNTINAVMDAAFGATQGAVAYRGASGWSSLAPGTSGQFMQTSGPSANPIWQTIPGGGNMLSSTYDPTNKLANAFDSANLSFLQSGTGAVARPALLKMRDIVSVKDFNAKGDGSTDDTAAMQRAHDTGQRIYYPKGNYLFSGNINASAGGICGDGMGATILTLTNAANDGINFSIANTLTGPALSDFMITASVAKSAGASIRIKCSTVGGEVYWPSVDRVLFFQNQYDCLSVENVRQFDISGSRFINYSNTGITTFNSSNPDGGDWSVRGCVFNTAISSGTRVGLRYFSGGGGKIIGNKFLGGGAGIAVNIDHNSPMADLLIVSNSIEDYLTAGISLSRNVGNTGTLGGIDIIGNNIAGKTNTTYGIFSSPGAAAFADLNIKANRFYTTANNYTHIGIDWANGVHIDTNMFDAAAGTTGGKGILCDINCVNTFVGAGNMFVRTATPIQNNSSTGVTQLHSQSGSSSAVTPGTANYGSFFLGTGSVTFPAAFGATPTSVVATVKDGSGVGSVGVMVSGLTSTGFTFQVIGITASQTIPITWEAKGVISR